MLKRLRSAARLYISELGKDPGEAAVVIEKLCNLFEKGKSAWDILRFKAYLTA